MLACLIADEEDFVSNFAETDVDIYLIGVEGLPFKERVAVLVKRLYRAAKRRGIVATVLRTPCTITLSMRSASGCSLPNIQIVMAPFQDKKHLLSTTDLDCTSFGFDGHSLFTTFEGRDAVAHRCLVVRPDKYCVRGEWSSASRLFKYAMRGFAVVDNGLRPDVEAPDHAVVEALAVEASRALRMHSLCKAEVESQHQTMVAIARDYERKLRATGVHGAYLMLLAQANSGLRELLMFDVPLLPAGLGDRRLLGTVTGCDAMRDDDGYERLRSRGSRKAWKLQVLYPCRPHRTIRCAIWDSIEERDPDAMLDTRSWYDGLNPEHLLKDELQAD